ncbi:MAG TPA: type IX secretion system membrane protein PorP/SprF [Prolixibacteraceae bacterium]|nr:type IX secretion system membrane protein PorP/SprF [Prolixibacteraceae bacterium]
MNKVKYILFFIVLISGLNGMAQQDPMYTQYMNQLLTINPAYAGAKGVTSASLIVREQWVGWTGNPKTQTFFVHSPLNTEMGVGGSIMNDRIGIVNNFGIFGDYSYTITYPGEKYLSFGLKAGFSFFDADLSSVNLGESDQDDPAFKNDIKYKFLPNAGVGVYLSSPKYYLGISVPKLITNKISSSSVETGTAIREELHAFFMGGYVFDMNRILKFKPYFMLRFTPNAPISTDLTGQFVFFEKIWLGATYRVGDGFGAMLQAQVTQQLKIGYAYDLTTNELGAYNSGTHEVLINYDFSFGRGRVRSPRYF